MEVIISGETYPLPTAATVELLQQDDSTITLGPLSVGAGGSTVSITPTKATATYTVSGLTLVAKPFPYKKIKKPALDPLTALLNFLEGLTKTASDIASGLEGVAASGASWAEGTITDDAIKAVIPRFNALISALEDFASGGAGAAKTFAHELDDLTAEGRALAKPMLNEAAQAIDWAKNTRDLLKSLAHLKGPVIRNLKRNWLLYTEGTALLVATRQYFHSFSKLDWAHAGALSHPQSKATKTAQTSTEASSSSSTATSSSAKPTSTYFVYAQPGTDLNTFKNFVNELDDGAGQIVSDDILQFRSYTTELDQKGVDFAKSQSFVYTVSEILPADKQLESGEATDFDARALPLKHFGPDVDTDFLSDSHDPMELQQNATEHLYKRVVQEIPGKRDHVRLLSQKPQSGEPVDPTYYYADTPNEGEGQTIFVLDTGFNPDISVRSLAFSCRVQILTFCRTFRLLRVELLIPGQQMRTTIFQGRQT